VKPWIRATPWVRLRLRKLWLAMESAFKAGGVQLVTVPVDYSENQRVLVDELAKLGS
jgi:acetolactate synthase I/II/III large subunit